MGLPARQNIGAAAEALRGRTGSGSEDARRPPRRGVVAEHPVDVDKGVRQDVADLYRIPYFKIRT